MMVENPSGHSLPHGLHSTQRGTRDATSDTRSLDELADDYLSAALRGDRNDALEIIRTEANRGRFSVAQIYLGVIQRAQYQIGKRWEDGYITVAQEHLATGISQIAIAQLYALMPRTPAVGHLVLVSCVPGETHDMGPRILADFFEMAGFDVRYLGADVPIEDILNAIREHRPSIVALSATMSYNLPAFEDTVLRIRSEFGQQVQIAAGGQAFQLTPELLDELRIEIRAENAQELVDRTTKALGLI